MKIKSKVVFIVSIISLCSAVFLFQNIGVHAASYSVTNTGDSGEGSLREALTDLDSSVDATNTIEFNIPGSGPHTITLESALPEITRPVHINGTTQGDSLCGANITPMIRLDLNDNSGLIIGELAAGTTIEGLAIYGTVAYEPTITFDGANSTLRCSFVGTADGSTLANTNDNFITDVLIYKSGVTIGGSDVADRNIIVGNGSSAIANAYEESVNGLTVSHNYIGINKAGTARVGSGGNGIFFNYGTQQNITITDNVIAGHYQQIMFYYVEPDSGPFIIKRNKLGTNASGTAAIPSDSGNSGGIMFYTNNGSTEGLLSVGGPDEDDGNIIVTSGSGEALYLNYVTNVLIQNNYFNTSSDGESMIASPDNGNTVIRYYNYGLAEDEGNFQLLDNVINTNSTSWTNGGVGLHISGGSGEFIVRRNIFGLSKSQDEKLSALSTAIYYAAEGYTVPYGYLTLEDNVLGGVTETGRLIYLSSGRIKSIKRNILGTDSTFTKDFGSAGSQGISECLYNQYPLIGGTDPADGNHIYNLGTGYETCYNTSTILGNIFVNNTLSGNPYDPAIDSRPAPIIESARLTNEGTELELTFPDDSVANPGYDAGDYRIEIFKNPTEKNANDGYDATEFFAAGIVTKAVAGEETVTLMLPGVIFDQNAFITLTATTLDDASPTGFSLTSALSGFSGSITDERTEESDNTNGENNDTGSVLSNLAATGQARIVFMVIAVALLVVSAFTIRKVLTRPAARKNSASAASKKHSKS